MVHAGQTSRRDPLPAGSRYELLVKIASGGMASVYLGRLSGAVGFRRTVAIKRAHAHLLEEPELRRMLIAEANLAARIHHPNVVSVLDVEQLDEELLLVMDYVEGAALSELMAIGTRSSTPLPTGVALRIALDACAGLHAAHELTDEEGRPLGIIHRDVSPQNILVGVDGMARIADFGIAKVHAGTSATNTGALKGKVAYMAPEYIEGNPVDVRSDVFGLGVVVWEALANQRLFRGSNELEVLRKVAEAPIPRLSDAAPWVGAWLDEALATALQRDPARRYPSARAFAEALEGALRARREAPASAAEVGALVRERVGSGLEQRRARLREMMASGHSDSLLPEPPTLPAARALTSPGPQAPTPTATPMPLTGATLAAAGLTPAAGASPSTAEIRLSAGPELTTLGSGASSQPTLGSAAWNPGARRRRVALVVGGIGAVMAALVVVALRSAGTDEPVAPAEGVTAAAAASVSAPAPAPAPVSASAPAPATAPATASASAPATAPATASASAPATAPATASAAAQPVQRPAGVRPARPPRPSAPSVGAPAPNPYATKR